MSFEIALVGGDAHGAWFSGHALTGPPPETIPVAVGICGAAALLDLPDDQLELGERLLTYVLSGTAFVCDSRTNGRSVYVATYVPQEEGLDPGEGFRRHLLHDAGLR
jgi:hypothetical protein